MAVTPLRLFIDIDAKKCVMRDTNAAGYSLPSFLQGDTVQLEVTLLKRTAYYPGNYGQSPYEKVSVSGLTLRVGIGTPTAATGSGAPAVAYQNSFSTDTTNNKFTGTLEISASGVQTLLGSNTSGSATFEVEVAESGAYTTVLQESVTVKAELIEGATSNPTPTDSYMTRNESLATFVKKYEANGATITLPDSTGTYALVLGCNPDGTVKMDVVTL